MRASYVMNMVFPRKLVDWATTGTAALISHQGPSAAGGELNIVDDYVSGYILWVWEDGKSTLLHKSFIGGQTAIDSLKDTMGNEFQINFSDPQQALRLLTGSNQAQRVVDARMDAALAASESVGDGVPEPSSEKREGNVDACSCRHGSESGTRKRERL
jgi:hypothetical protein